MEYIQVYTMSVSMASRLGPSTALPLPFILSSFWCVVCTQRKPISSSSVTVLR
jgi:hypothetical protein